MTQRDPSMNKPRTVRINCLVSQIIDIDVVNQTFTAQFTLSATWEIDVLPTGWTLKNFKDKKIKESESKIEKSSIHSEDGKILWSPRLTFRNKIDDFKDEEIWWDIVKRGNNDVWMIYNIRAIGVFQQQMKLHNFPVDSQQLSIQLLSGWEEGHSEHSVCLEKDLKKDSLVKIGKMKDEYVLNDDDLNDVTFMEFNVSSTDKDESARGLSYPYVSISAILTRNPSYYLHTVWFPTFLFT